MFTTSGFRSRTSSGSSCSCSRGSNNNAKLQLQRQLATATGERVGNCDNETTAFLAAHAEGVREREREAERRRDRDSGTIAVRSPRPNRLFHISVTLPASPPPVRVNVDKLSLSEPGRPACCTKDWAFSCPAVGSKAWQAEGGRREAPLGAGLAL